MYATACLRALLLFAACACFGASDARACSATAQDVFSVGNTAADSSCNYGSIQAAINAASCPVGTKIFINQSGDYTNQHLAITDKNITLIGRTNTPKCNTPVVACGVPPLFLQCPTAPLRTIDGSNTNGSVVTVRGSSNVTVQYLTITGGKGDRGGGIDYAGIGDLNINTSTIDNNTAENGGGIRVEGTGGGTARLILNANTLITNNTANASGGGIRAEDYSITYIDPYPIWIALNEATNGKGGGIVAVGGASVYIGSPGYLSAGVIYGNTAQYGGGIAGVPTDDASPTFEIVPTDPSRPVRIEQNQAYHTGGGIYLGSDDGSFSGHGPAVANLYGAQIDYNVAQEGSGVYADTLSSALSTGGAYIEFYPTDCAAGIECNTVSNNSAADGNGNPTAGSAILIQSRGSLQAQQLTMRGNQGAHAIRVLDTLRFQLQLDTCLLAGNTVDDALITLGNASASINQCTIANNTSTSPGHPVVLANADLTLTNSIFAQGSQETLRNMDGGASMTLDYLMSGETDSLIGGNHTIQSDPDFVDSANGDFHLRLGSLAVDYAPAGASSDKDLDNRPRDQDLPERLNAYGPRDLGAYERQLGACDASDTIFCNGFDNP